MAYAREVYEYNKFIIKGDLKPNLVQKFGLVAEEFNDTVSTFSINPLKNNLKKK